MKFIGHRFVFAAAAALAGANAMVMDSSIVTNAVFDRGVSAMFSPTISDYDKADILAFHIPAVSSPAIHTGQSLSHNFRISKPDSVSHYSRNLIRFLSPFYILFLTSICLQNYFIILNFYIFYRFTIRI